ncbi:MAG: SWIM zinc finger family protein [Candidatus Altiarchaeales archaeon]|nr:SWIM zinc finger family protein [Candidatus Altiarchaeales archaeon]
MEPTELNWDPEHNQYFQDRSLEEPIEPIFRQTLGSGVRARVRNGKNKQYDLLIDDRKAACTCPDFHKRGRICKMPCKHLWVLKRDIEPHNERVVIGGFDYV